MTLSELYQSIEGDYEQAMRVLCMEKMIDKYIRKFPETGVIDALLQAGKAGDDKAIFENAHAAKGVCANLGLIKLAALSAALADEFRPGHSRAMSDTQVRGVFSELDALYRKTQERIQAYTRSL